ncbi:hypothetical protein [Halalkalibacter alkaliphilus]|uniref:Uncharacterized protein n=1 Tax=Halalkalibacter alkaliphilus TaxID=2917993 RepID=A0A9X2I4D8_9BACI|nr:hypothetical protein [Halalkalibacter alkaliphilus]MCL7747428.1 hypothetical protein [Halalkalibacter alkaliphilus]
MKKIIFTLLVFTGLVVGGSLSSLSVPSDNIRINSEPTELAVPSDNIRINTIDTVY